MLKIDIRTDYFGNLQFTIFGVGHAINEQIVFRQERILFKEGESPKEPSFTVPNISAPEFMSALKQAISEFDGWTDDHMLGELKATKYHLEDMRKIAKLS